MRASLYFTDRHRGGPKGRSHRRTSGWQTLRNTTPASSSCVYAVTACPLSTQNMFWGWKPVLRANKVWSDNTACLSWNSLSLHGRAALSQTDFGTFFVPSASAETSTSLELETGERRGRWRMRVSVKNGRWAWGFVCAIIYSCVKIFWHGAFISEPLEAVACIKNITKTSHLNTHTYRKPYPGDSEFVQKNKACRL